MQAQMHWSPRSGTMGYIAGQSCANMGKQNYYVIKLHFRAIPTLIKNHLPSTNSN